MPQIKANHLMIEYDEAGPKDGPTLLLIMGLAAQMTFWPEGLIRAFADAGFRVIRFDNRDIGLSAKLHGKRAPNPIAQAAARFIGINGLAPYTLHDMVHDTVGLLDALKIKRAHVVGVSMGGMIAQLMAATHPRRVASLTSIMSGTLNPRLRKASIAATIRRAYGGSWPQSLQPATCVPIWRRSRPRRSSFTDRRIRWLRSKAGAIPRATSRARTLRSSMAWRTTCRKSFSRASPR
jgi:pimeloyl-ACP methyl ester carboxylesterase